MAGGEWRAAEAEHLRARRAWWRQTRPAPTPPAQHAPSASKPVVVILKTCCDQEPSDQPRNLLSPGTMLGQDAWCLRADTTSRVSDLDDATRSDVKLRRC